jgi:hypothetical protein
VEAFSFQKHGAVARVLLCVVGGLVHSLSTFLMRWRCGVCGRTFRHYPEGVAPHKRYVVLDLVRYGSRYLSEPAATYRRVVQSEGPLRGQPILHAEEAAEADWSEARKEGERGSALSHTTLWRFLGFVGSLSVGWTRPFREQGRIEASEVDFSAWLIAPHKYRSESRRTTLVLAAKRLAVLVPAAKRRFPTEPGTMSSGP